MIRKSLLVLVVLVSTAMAAPPAGELRASDAPIELKPATQVNLPIASVVALAYSPDGKQLAVGGRGRPIRDPNGPPKVGAATKYAGCEIYLLDAATLAQSAKLEGHTSIIGDLAYVADGKTLASASYDNSLRLWDLASPTFESTVQPLDLSGTYQLMGVSPGERFIAWATKVDDPNDRERTIHVWDAVAKKEVRTFTTDAMIRSIGISHDGQYVAIGQDIKIPTGSSDGVVLYRLGKAETFTELVNAAGWMKDRANTVSCLQFSPDGARIYVGRHNGLLEVWDVAASKMLTVWKDNPQSVSTMAMSRDGQLIAAGGGTIGGKDQRPDCTIRLHRASDGKVLATAPGHTMPLGAVTLTPDGRHMASCGQEKNVKVWDLSELFAK